MNTESGKSKEVLPNNLLESCFSVTMYKKGWCKVCNLVNTILRAINMNTTALNCELWIEWILQCSNKEAEAADDLSKCDYLRFIKNLPCADPMPRAVPRTLLAWMEDPKHHREVGGRILEEMSEATELMGYLPGQKI